MTGEDTGDDEAKLREDPTFKRLRALRARLSGGYSLFVLGLFALFVAASALFPETMAASVAEGSPFTIAMLAALAMVVVPVILAAAFLRKTDRDIEPIRAGLAGKRDPGDPQL